MKDLIRKKIHFKTAGKFLDYFRKTSINLFLSLLSKNVLHIRLYIKQPSKHLLSIILVHISIELTPYWNQCPDLNRWNIHHLKKYHKYYFFFVRLLNLEMNLYLRTFSHGLIYLLMNVTTMITMLRLSMELNYRIYLT